MFAKHSRRRITTATTIAIAGFAAAIPATVLAQQSMLEEVVVTAQKREQSLQDVSMSLSAFTGDALETRAIEDMADLQFSVPNLVADGARIAIRGVGNNAISSTAEGGLGFHINGVYVNRPLLLSQEYFDLERIEVLRGPQGTLYGRNTTAGVINVLTRKPGEELGGDVTVTVGNYDTYKVKGAFNIPLSDNVRQRFAGSYITRDGYSDNIFDGKAIDGRDAFDLRSSTSFDFGDNTSVDLVISYLKEDSDRSSQTKGTCTKDAELGCSPLSAGFEAPDASRSIFRTIDNVFLGGSLIPPGDYFADTNNPADYRKVNVDQKPTYEAEQLGVTLEIQHQMGSYNLTSLTGYYETETDIFGDFDRFSSSVRLNYPVTYRADTRDVITTDRIVSGRRDVSDAEQFSQEFRIASEYDGRFNFLLGAFYFEEDFSGQALFTHPTIAAAQQGLGLSEEFELYNIETDPLETESLAFFGEGYFDLTDKTRLTVGLRYTDDEKSVRTRQQFLVFINPDWIEEKNDWQETTGKVTVEHFFGDDSMFFVTLARGYKAGGVNPGSKGDDQTFDPEYIDQFEVGSKNTFMDGRLRANFGAFFYDYEGLQIGQVDETSAVTVNGDSTVKGVEAEFIFAATDSLEFDLNLSWLKLELDDFVSADTSDPNGIAPGVVPALDENGDPRYTGPNGTGNLIQDLDGNAVRNAPEHSVKIGAQYSTGIIDGYQLTGRVDHFWQDEYYANEFNKPSDVIDSWEQTDLQLMLEPNAGNWRLKAFVKNAADNDDVIRRGQDGPTAGRFRSVTVLEPRTYGLELSLMFE